MNIEFHAAIVKHIDAVLNEKCHNIVNGSPGDWGEYRYRVGYVKALNDLLGQLPDIIKKLQRGTSEVEDR